MFAGEEGVLRQEEEVRGVFGDYGYEGGDVAEEPVVRGSWQGAVSGSFMEEAAEEEK